MSVSDVLAQMKVGPEGAEAVAAWFSGTTGVIDLSSGGLPLRNKMRKISEDPRYVAAPITNGMMCRFVPTRRNV